MIRIGDISDLPIELRDQLLCIKKREKQDPILGIFKDLEGTATIDEIMVHYYRRYNEILSRQWLSNKIYRLTKKGFLKPLLGKRGIYKLIEGTHD